MFRAIFCPSSGA